MNSTEKICFKSDGTIETGAKIIKALEELGGKNTGGCSGTATLRNYYYIDNVDEIEASEIIPEEYTLKDIYTWKQKTLSKEDLLEEARRKYPIGTKVKSLFHEGNPILAITDNVFSHCREDGIHVSGDETKMAVVYEDGQWAEIVSQPQEKPSKDKPFYVVVTEENKEILGKWSGRKFLETGYITGLVKWENAKKLSCEYNPIGQNKGVAFTYGNEITFEQFLEMYPEYKKEVKPKFEIGKWYKNLGSDLCHIAKFSGWNGNIMKASEYIYTKGGLFCSTASDNFTTDYKNAELLTDLSEIQQYLPDGHIDKVVEKKSLVGRYLKVLNGFKPDKYLTIEREDKDSIHIFTKEYPKEAQELQWKIERRYMELMPEGFIPEQEVKEFILPEKWCIECTKENQDALNKWREYEPSISRGRFMYNTYKGYSKKGVSQAYKDPEYTEITFEQFKEHVLKEKVEEKVDVLVQTNMSQLDACNTCKYHEKCHTAPHNNAEKYCPATGGKHYPKDKVETKEEQWIPQVGDWIVSLEDREPYRKKGDIFQVLEVVLNNKYVYYEPTTNGELSTFRKATQKEIEKELKRSNVLKSSTWIKKEQQRIREDSLKFNAAMFKSFVKLKDYVDLGLNLEYPKTSDDCFLSLKKKGKSKTKFSNFVSSNESVGGEIIPKTKSKLIK